MNSRLPTHVVLVLILPLLFFPSLAAQDTGPAGVPTPLLDPGWTSKTFPAQDWPASKIPEAEALSQQAVQALNSGQGPSVVFPLLQKAVALDPNHPFAWWRLGSLQLAVQTHDVGVATMRHQTEVAPSPTAFKHAGNVLHLSGFNEDAIVFWRDGSAKFPDDRELPALLGEGLLAVQDFAGAIEVLSAQVALHPNSSRLHLNLGRALLRSGKPDEAMPHLKLAGELEPAGTMWTSVARTLVEANAQLDLALDDARRAVAEMESATLSFTVPPADRLGPGTMGRLVAAWDALARVLLRRGDLAGARAYATAAWELCYRPEAASLVGQIDEARQDTPKAIQFYALAMITGQPKDLFPAGRLAALVTSNDERNDLINQAKQTYSQLANQVVTRTGDLSELAANFTVLLGVSGVVERAAAVTSTGPNGAGEALASLLVGRRMGPPLPPNENVRMLREGRMTCGQGQANCRLALRPTQSVLTDE